MTKKNDAKRLRPGKLGRSMLRPYKVLIVPEQSTARTIFREKVFRDFLAMHSQV